MFYAENVTFDKLVTPKNIEISKTNLTRQSEMTNTSPRHMAVLGNVHPIKIENLIFLCDVISLLARVFILLIDTATQEVPLKNI